jgi:protein TonB
MVQSEVARSSGYPLLDEAALRRLSDCRFKPGTDAQGNAVGGSFYVEYVWRLQ